MGGQQVDTMANPEHMAKLKEGAEAWNRWRAKSLKAVPGLGVNLEAAQLKGARLRGVNLRRVDLREADLSEADLGGTDLRGADLSGARLVRSWIRGANLGEAHLEGTDLSWADLSAAILRGARLRGADLSGAKLGVANLSDADLDGADLNWADLSGADLHNARLNNAVIGNSIFGDNDLTTVKGLLTVRHLQPSTIGIDTIYRSKGNIPESFLRGCGVPDDFITFMRSLTANPIEFYSCFISYSTKDQGFADRLYADLQNKGVRCWFAPHDVQGGKKLHEQIDEAIRLHDKLLLILSPHSMESEWVKTEIAKARKREVRDPEGVLKRRVLFPIRLAPFETLRDWECFDADTGKDSAREIREYFIPDFSNWKDHDSYQKAFQRLIADLKSSDSSSHSTK
jgi:uncharacterized protein YjbI with pentapeptide repeats